MQIFCAAEAPSIQWRSWRTMRTKRDDRIFLRCSSASCCFSCCITVTRLRSNSRTLWVGDSCMEEAQNVVVVTFLIPVLMCATATEVLIERHLDDILNNNKQAVVGAFQTEIKKTLKAQNRRKKASQASCI